MIAEREEVPASRIWKDRKDYALPLCSTLVSSAVTVCERVFKIYLYKYLTYYKMC